MPIAVRRQYRRRPRTRCFLTKQPGLIDFDYASNSGYVSSSSSVTFDHTCQGVERYLVLVISHLTSVSVLTATYNSVSMVQLVNQTNADGGQVEIWGLANPTLGTNSVSVTMSAATDFVVSALSFSGVRQKFSQETEDGRQGTGTPSECYVSTVTDENWIVAGLTTLDTSVTVAS